ncbi:hypothetical protein [Lysinibacillus fusiformis]
MEQSGYDYIAKAIGEVMDEAWEKFMNKVADGDLTFLGESNFTEENVKQFYALLGGAELGITFSNNSPSGTKKYFNSHDITSTNFMRGSLTIGTRIEW